MVCTVLHFEKSKPLQNRFMAIQIESKPFHDNSDADHNIQ